MRVSRLVVVIAVLGLVGCVPDLGGWQVEREDAGERPPFDAGGLRVDAGGTPIGPPPDCSSPIPLGAGYREGFEAGPSGWGVTSENPMVPSSWEWGRPAGEMITRAAEGESAFATRLSAQYTNHEESLLVSPCFDASSAAHDLLITLSVAAFTEESFDRVALEYSVDGGGSWQVAMGERRIGWYDGPGFGGTRDWSEGSTLLPGTAGQPRVQLRFRFHSDESAIRGDGVAIDDVFLRPASVDLAIALTEAPRCGWAVATVTNVGGVPLTGFEIRGDVDGAPSAAPFDGELRYLATQSIEIGGPLAATTRATVFTVGDEVPDNDAATMGHAARAFGSGYFSDFESDDGGLVVEGSPTSWAWGVPDDALIRSAASGTHAWMTGLGADYGPNERGYLMLPCYDMRALTRDPQVSLARVFDTEACCDFGRVEVSIDGGDFVTVGGTMSGGTGWYGMASGWSGSSGAGLWQVAQHPLTNAHGHAAVRARIAFHSDTSAQGEGFGIDDLALIP
ncbi:MAG: hypothetical protein H6719_35585 [Sandaracinaceae bacterium]|nr:hypothetical protein [Sandaracinaceae bacterium]